MVEPLRDINSGGGPTQGVGTLYGWREENENSPCQGVGGNDGTNSHFIAWDKLAQKSKNSTTMSLSTINSPPLVGALTLGCYAALPFISFESPTIPWAVVKGANLLAYGISLWSTSQPGRYDSEAAGQDPSKKTTGTATTDMDKMGTGRRGRTLVPPAGWAFAIWAPIFVGEMIIVTYQSQLPESSNLVPLIRKVTGPYVLAQTFQSLWTASFRPKYNQGLYKYISALNLSGIALSLSLCHSAYTSEKILPQDYWLNFLPLSLHFGWTTAACLVNWNGMFALEATSPKHVAWFGHASVLVATVVGVATTLKREAPVYGGVIAWALSAVASGLARRIQETEKVDVDTVGVYGAKRQRLLSMLGAAACAAASLFVTIRQQQQ